MKTLRRYVLKGVAYFITICTYNRKRLLLKDIGLFWDCWKRTKPESWVILPDHFHIIINPQNQNISDIIHAFKIKYSRLFRDKYRSGQVWQNRFWEHVIRDQDDLNNHLNYVHYNPVKHGLTNDPFEYKYSSLNNFYRIGYYPRDWGVINKLEFKGDFGE